MWVRKYKDKIRYVESYKDPMTDKHKEVSIVFPKDTKSNRKQAEEILRLKIASACDTSKSSITFGWLADQYIKNLSSFVRESSVVHTEITVRKVCEIIGSDTLVDRLTAIYITQQFRSKLSNNTTINTYIVRTKAILNWAHAQGLMESRNQIDLLKKLPTAPPQKPKYMESDELQLLLSGLKVERWRLLTEFLALSGLRIGEAIALNKDDIDLQSGVIHISKSYDQYNKKVSVPKTDASADDIFIQTELEECIHKINAYILRTSILRGIKSKLFFPDSNGDYLTYNTYNKYFKSNTERIIGKRLTPHSLRHTHASLLFEQGFTLDEVSRRLRHSDSKVTKDIYIHVTKKLKEKDAEHLRNVRLL